MYRLLVCLVFATFSLNTYAQKGAIKGFIFDKADAEGIPYAGVKVDSTDFGAATDEQGFFYIPNLPEGTYNLRFSYIGYEPQTQSVTVKKNQTVNLKIFLSTKSVELQDIEISAEKQQRKTETRVSVTSVGQIELKRMPTVGGEPDIAQYLQVLPGVVSTGDQGGQVVIRGGTPIQTRFLLDGITIYNPFHSIGLFSVFETDVIKNVDVYTGGFPAQYGGRVSAVVDVTTKDGNRKKVSGKVGASPFMAHALLEIPVVKIKEDKNTSASLILSSKVSYLDRTSKALYPYAGNEGLPYSFVDIYGKFTLFTGKAGSKMTISGFNFRDNARFNAAKYGWNTFGVGFNFLAVPKNSNLYFNTHFSYSQYEINLTEADNRPRKSLIGGFDIGMDFAYFIKNGELKYGLNIDGNRTEFSFFNSSNIKFEQNQNTTDISAYMMYHKYVKKFVVEAGARIQYYGNISAFSPEPRLSVKYNINDIVRLKMATGLYSQNFISTKSDRDVVNLFNGFLSGPEEAPANAAGVLNEKTRNMQRSVHGIFGVELDLPQNITVNIEPYYKYFWNLLNINRFKQFNTDANFIIERGDAYGIDLMAKWEWKGVYLYTTYSLAWTNRFDGVQKYPPHFDRRHNLNVLAAYTFGKKKDFEISSRFNLGTGFPFTQNQAFIEGVNFNDGVSTDYTSANGDLNILYSSKINGGRLPMYHRLDLSFKKTFNIKDKVKIELNASVSNVYNRENIFYFDRARFTRVNQLPILPSMGMSIGF
jgi:hypothetical protein